MYRILSLQTFVFALALALPGCAERTPASNATSSEADPSPPAPAAEAPREAFYSPFVVDVPHASVPFSQITFKDVGMSLAPEDRAHVYEVVAESVRESLQSEGIEASVSYAAEWSEPEHHLACQGEHLYVDMWQSGADRWGYSLWSGCEEESEFGRGDVLGDRDPVVAASPVAAHIAQRIQAAVDARCFRKHC